MLTQEKLKQLLNYDSETGLFSWKARWRVKSGCVAGTINRDGYRVVRVLQQRVMAHRLVWLYMTGKWPENEIDHRNGVRDDNRWSNLREATHAENQQNRPKNGNNTSGFTGAYWEKRRNRWLSQIRVDGKQIHLGYFDDAESAHSAYVAAKAKLHRFNPAVRVS